MKTNVKIPRNVPAVAFITPDNFLLNYYYQGKELTVDSSVLLTDLNDGIESKTTAVLSQINCSSCKLIIILSAQLTLYSEQILPCDLSDEQVGELLMLQLSNRTDSGEINTFYDYFLLKKTQVTSTYGLIEARKDVLNTWINLFENHGFYPVAIVSQPIVLINHIIKNIDINAGQFEIVCLLPTRILVAHVDENQVKKITEHVTSGGLITVNSIANTISNHLGQVLPEQNHRIIVLDTVDCGIADELAENFRIFPGFHKEQVQGENTIKWLRAKNDMYQSVALA